MKIDKYPKYNQTIYNLDINGLKVVCIPDSNFNAASVSLLVNYGATDIEYQMNGKKYKSELGSAHFLEHKIFELKDGSDAFSKMSSLGADANAYTSYDETVYTFNTSINFYETFNIFLEYIFTNTLNTKTINKEKGIINEELMMYLDKPRYQVQARLLENLYTNCYIKDQILGTEESIQNTDLDNLSNIYEAFYQPSNMILSVTGNFDVNELEGFLKKELSKYKTKNNQVEKIYPKEPKEVKLKDEILEIDSEVNYVALGIKFDENKSKDFVRNSMIMDAYSYMLFSKSMYSIDEMIKKEVLYPNFSYDLIMNNNYNFIEFVATSDKQDELITTLKENILNFKFTDEDFEIFKKVSKSGFIYTLDNLEDLSYEITTGMLYDYNYFDYIDIIDSITKEDVINLAKEIKEENISIIKTKNFE